MEDVKSETGNVQDDPGNLVITESKESIKDYKGHVKRT